MKARTGIRILYLGIAAYAAAASVRVLLDRLALPLPAAERDADSRDIERYRGLREALAGTARVGFAHDRAGERSVAELIDDITRAQYALLPVLISLDAGQELVIGNFADEQAVPELARQRGYAIVSRFGEGVFLLRTEP